jgi:hypothetical protein
MGFSGLSGERWRTIVRMATTGAVVKAKEDVVHPASVSQDLAHEDGLEVRHEGD